jgi:hypothetical protein
MTCTADEVVPEVGNRRDPGRPGRLGDRNDDFLALLDEQSQLEKDEVVSPVLIEAIESRPAGPMTRQGWDEDQLEIREKPSKPFLDERDGQAVDGSNGDRGLGPAASC